MKEVDVFVKGVEATRRYSRGKSGITPTFPNLRCIFLVLMKQTHISALLWIHKVTVASVS